jgi:GTP-binding protein
MRTLLTGLWSVRSSRANALGGAARGTTVEEGTGPRSDASGAARAPAAGMRQSGLPEMTTPSSAAPAAATATRDDVRDIAIVAHVDHGKTTLVDAMLRQSGTFRANQAVVERVLDSGDLEREKGITILAKQTAFEYRGVHLNIVDTPGHADFGGEVERSLNLVDAVLLLVDAAEGPLPQTRYVLQKAMARRLPVVVAVNKIDRGDARPREVVDAIYELFIDLGADAGQIDFPIAFTNAKAGTATLDLAHPGRDLQPLLDLLLEHTPAPIYRPGHPLQLLVTNLSANDYVGRMAVGRIWNGTLRLGQRIAIVRAAPETPEGHVEPERTETLLGTVTSLTTARGIERVEVEEARPGDIVAVAGLPEVTIGDTITDPGDPRPLPRLEVDEPTLAMTFGVNTSPLAGREGRLLTSRQIRARLEREVLGNVAIEVRDTASPDTFEVRGRGELQLAVLIEQMRREGYELQVSRPEVILHDVGGEVQEPYERITVDIPPEFIGSVQQSLAARCGRLEQLSSDADGRVRLDYVIPVRGLVGYRGQLLTETRGTALLHQIGEGYGPWAGEVAHRTSGDLVADRQGTSNAYGLFNLQQRAELFVGPNVEVYEGMVVGENSRPDDMDVNPTKEKKLTNIRTHAHDEALRLTPPRELTLEAAIEFIAADELVEVTPASIRLRKRILSMHERRREAGREYERRLVAERKAEAGGEALEGA